MENISERDVKIMGEGRYNRLHRKVWWIGLILLVLFMAGIMTWASNESGPYYKWTLPDGKEIIGEKTLTPMFYIDGELIDVQEEKIPDGRVDPFTVLGGVVILMYGGFILYVRRQQKFADGLVETYKETGEVPDTLVDHTLLKKEKKKK